MNINTWTDEQKQCLLEIGCDAPSLKLSTETIIVEIDNSETKIISVETRPSLQGLLENNNCADIGDLSLETLSVEIYDIKEAIENAKLCEMESPTLDESDKYRENIANMQGYLKLLLDAKEEREKHIIKDNRHNPDGKIIRFIDSRYNELFKIPDGDYIKITLNSGELLIRKCAFIDECHTSVGNSSFHICEFAERMERAGNKYEPCPTPEKVMGYMITDRMSVNEKEFVLAHNPKAADPWVTWVKNNYEPGYEIGHYWSKKNSAHADYICRADAERTGRHYDHTKLYKENRDSGAR